MDSAYARSLRDLADAEAPGAVRFVKGAVQPQALALMASAVATVVSSRVENPGRVPVEAMTLGSPILAADTPSVRDSCGDAARYYPAGDHRRLADHMSSLLSDAAAGDDLRARGRERVSGNEPLSATRTLIEALGLGS
jgi:glycosyltransferase involved in cell wall biosynthesis